MSLNIKHPEKPTESNKIDDNDYMLSHTITGNLEITDLPDVLQDLLSTLSEKTFLLPQLIEEVILPYSYNTNSGNNSNKTDPNNGTLNALSLISIDNNNPGFVYRYIAPETNHNIGTWEYKIRPNCGPNGNTFEFMLSYANQYHVSQYSIMIFTPNNTINLIKYDSGGNPTTLITSAFGTWEADHVIKLTRDSSGNFELFLDGTSLGTATDNTITSFNYQLFYMKSTSYYNAECLIDYLKKDTLTVPITYQLSSYTFSNLNPTDVNNYLLKFNLPMPEITALRINFNGDTTANNYDQYIQLQEQDGAGHHIRNWSNRDLIARHLSNALVGDLKIYPMPHGAGYQSHINMFPYEGWHELGGSWYNSSETGITSIKILTSQPSHLLVGMLNLYKLLNVEL